MNNEPRVVIVGGGFGGLSAARGLAGAPVRVTLIDKRNYHLFRPMLYQVATGLLSADQISGPLRSILSHSTRPGASLMTTLRAATQINPKCAEMSTSRIVLSERSESKGAVSRRGF